jgi:hypothetical protein
MKTNHTTAKTRIRIARTSPAMASSLLSPVIHHLSSSRTTLSCRKSATQANPGRCVCKQTPCLAACRKPGRRWRLRSRAWHPS